MMFRKEAKPEMKSFQQEPYLCSLPIYSGGLNTETQIQPDHTFDTAWGGVVVPALHSHGHVLFSNTFIMFFSVCSVYNFVHAPK